MNTSEQQSRRAFLIRTGKAAGLAAISTGFAFALHRKSRSPFSVEEEEAIIRDLRIKNLAEKMVVAHGNDPARMTRAVIDNFGGMKTFIAKGDFVIIKPNIGWDRTPEQAANTNPDIIKTLVQLCFEAGAGKVLVTDMSCNDPRRCFMRSGIEQAARDAGASVEQPKDAKFKSVNMGGSMLGRQSVYQPYLAADKFINVPIAKHHSLTGATLGMKNLYGIIGGHRSKLHQDIHNSIADLGNFLRPTLTIMDAYRVLRRNGPQGGNLADVEMKNTLIASNDMVAIDAYAGETFFGLSGEKLGHLVLAERYGLGKADFRQVPMREISV